MSGSNQAHIHEEHLPLSRPGATLSNTGISGDGTQYFGAAALDVIAVQGLGASYPWTWSAKGTGTERYSWLRQTLPNDLPNARILAFEYDTKFYGDPTKTSLLECGRLLLSSIIEDRTHRQSNHTCPSIRKRPIVFIAHSFGGLVVKQALILASQTGPEDPRYQAHQDLLRCVAGVVFLGTPHRGSSLTMFAQIRNRVGKWRKVPSNDDLLKILKLDSALLEYVQFEFERMQSREEAFGLKLLCVYEKKEQTIASINVGYIVEKPSACLQGCHEMGLETDHSGLNKFGPRDRNYTYLITELQPICVAAASIVQGRFLAQTYASAHPSQSLSDLQRWLAPSTGPQKRQLEARFDDQQRTKSSFETCRWLENLDSFQLWKDPKTLMNVLWIFGKPGAGKSVLAAYVVKLLRGLTTTTAETITMNCTMALTQKDCNAERLSTTVLYFFCGIEQAKEFAVNLIGTFMHQLLCAHPENARLQEAVKHMSNEIQHREGPEIAALVKLLIDWSSILGPFYIILDGLEEHADFTKCLEMLSPMQNCSTIRLLILSQEPADLASQIVKTFPAAVSFDIKGYTADDIGQVIHHRTWSMLLDKPSLHEMAPEIIEQMQSEAGGVFQWVNACLEHLEDEFATNEEVSLATVQATLSDLSADLNKTYQTIFNRIDRTKATTDSKKTSMRFGFRLLCVAGTPMRACEIWTVVQLATLDEDRRSDKAYRETLQTLLANTLPGSDLTAKNHLARLFGSMIEFQRGDNDQIFVNLCHPSLKVFLMQKDDRGPGFFHVPRLEAHKQIARLCLRICTISSSRLYQSKIPVHQSPLILYAWTHWGFHFKLSAIELRDVDTMTVWFDDMVLAISEEVLRFSLVLGRYSTATRALSTSKDRLETAIAFQRAQTTMCKLVRDLKNIRLSLPLSNVLQTSRTAVKSHESEHAIALGGSGSDWVLVQTSYRDRSKAVNLAMDTIFASRPWDDIKLPSILNALGDVARGLRLTALQFAVSPVYQDFQTAFEDSPAIMVFLSHAALFFECIASYPVWESLPDYLDPEEAFVITSKEDQYYGAAAYLRHRLETQEKHHLSARSVEIANWTELHKKSIKPYHGMPTPRWIAAFYYYRMFRGPGGLGETFIINPMHNYHQKRLLHVEVGGTSFTARPERALYRYMPAELNDDPVLAFWNNIPVIIPIYYAKYVEVMSKVIWGSWGWFMLNMDHWRLTMAAGTIVRLVQFCYRLVFGTSGSGKTFVALVLAITLYVLRCRHLPGFAVHLHPHPMRDLNNAFFDPEKFFETYYSWTWMQYFRYLFEIWFGGSLAVFAMNMTFQRSPISDVARIYQYFWLMTGFERAICATADVIAPKIATFSLIFRQPSLIKALIGLSLTYWLLVVLEIFQTMMNLAMIANMGDSGWLAIVVIIIIFAGNITAIWSVITYFDRLQELVLGAAWTLTWPLRELWWMFFHAVVEPLLATSVILADLAAMAFIPILKLLGGAVALLMMYTGVRIFSAFCSDPLGLQETAGSLEEAMEAARQTLPAGVSLKLEMEPPKARVTAGPSLGIRWLANKEKKNTKVE